MLCGLGKKFGDDHYTMLGGGPKIATSGRSHCFAVGGELYVLGTHDLEFAAGTNQKR